MLKEKHRQMVYLSDSAWKALKKRAQEEATSVSELIRQAVKLLLKS